MFNKYKFILYLILTNIFSYYFFLKLYDPIINENSNFSIIFDLLLWILITIGVFYLSKSLIKTISIYLILFLSINLGNNWKLNKFGAPIIWQDFAVPFQMFEQLTSISVLSQLVTILVSILCFLYKNPFKCWIHRLKNILLIFLIIYFFTIGLSPQLQKIFFWQPGYNRKNSILSGVLLHTIVLESNRLFRSFFLKYSKSEVSNAKFLLKNSVSNNSEKTVPINPNLIITIQLESYVLPKGDNKILGCVGPEINQIIKNSKLNLSKLIVPTYIGGSSATEFEILCGLPANLVESRAGIEFGALIKNNLQCLPRILSLNGYSSTAFFPFQAQYFNEIKAYSLVGFSGVKRPDYQIINDFDGMHPSDLYIYDWVKNNISTQKHPQYIHIQTAAGHFPFDRNKLKRPDVIFCKNNKDQILLNRIYYSTVELLSFIDEIKKFFNKPIIFAYGDHKPLDIFSNEDMNSPINKFSTPLLTNYSIKNLDTTFAYELPFIIESLILNKESNLEKYSFNINEFYLRPIEIDPNFYISKSGEFISCNNKNEISDMCNKLSKKRNAARILVSDLLFGNS